MRIEIIPNFISSDEINALNSWAELGVSNKWLDKGLNKVQLHDLRVTSRLYADRYEYPQIVRDISKKIRVFLGIDDYPLISDHGRDGVVVSYTYPDGDVYPHKDPRSTLNFSALRCNILTQQADSGAQLYIDEQPINFNVGDLHCYLASEHTHKVSTVEGKTPRILWMFGAYVPAKHWNDGKIKVNNGLS